MSVGEARRQRLAEKRLLRNKERPHWSPLYQDGNGRFVNQPWLYKRTPSPSYKRAQQQQPQWTPSPEPSYIRDPYIRHQNYMANNFMDAARARYQHMKNDPAGYQKAYRSGLTNNNGYYAPVDKHEVLRMRREDDWERKRKGLNPRNWGNLF